MDVGGHGGHDHPLCVFGPGGDYLTAWYAEVEAPSRGREERGAVGVRAGARSWVRTQPRGCAASACVARGAVASLIEWALDAWDGTVERLAHAWACVALGGQGSTRLVARRLAVGISAGFGAYQLRRNGLGAKTGSERPGG